MTRIAGGVCAIDPVFSISGVVQVITRTLHAVTTVSVLAFLFASLGCAPADGPGGKPVGNVVETIEVIESEEVAAPAAGVVDSVRGTLTDLDKSIAAADKLIEEARIEDAAASIPARTSATVAETVVAAPAKASPVRLVSAAREQVMLGEPSLTGGVPAAAAGPITVAEIETWLADPKNHAELEPILPLGLSQGAGQITGLTENPLTRAKIELGRQLYFDTRLSADATVSCASCHDPDMGYSGNTKTGVGIRGQKGGRNSPVSFNRILSGPQFWDGRVDSLEAQAVGPIANPIEMGFTHEGVVERLAGIPVYAKQFETIFGELTIDRVGQAIAAFERALVTAPSPYDYGEQLRAFTGLDPDDIAEDEELAAKYAEAKAAAEAHPMSESAVRGRDLFFGKANCTACHVGANLADEKYHNLGVGMDKPEPDLGRFVVTKDERDTGAFKTPTVRNVALTGPYMHDGSQATLEEVVEWYDKGGHPNPHLSDKIKPLDLTAQDKADLVEFMKACTGPTPTVETSRLPADG
jgi:cytochrome c peroxidase